MRRTSVLAALAAAVLAPALSSHLARAQSPSDVPLRVIRVSPSGDALPTTPITVTFDRPVAGSLDRTVDPATILTVTPAVAGKLEWRDPVTIRLVPSAPLGAGVVYRVNVATTFTAMDGSRLAVPYSFTFRAKGPTLLTGSPIGNGNSATHVAPNQRLELVYSAPVDLAKLSLATYAEFNAPCAGARRVVRMRATSQRPVQPNDPQQYLWARRAWGTPPDTMRRVVQLQPVTAMPYGCAGDLVMPEEVADNATSDPARWPFSTYGDLRLGDIQCGWSDTGFCATGPIRIRFTNPVHGGDVRRYVKLYPATAFTMSDTSEDDVDWTLDAALKPHVTYAVVVDTALRDVFGQPLSGNPARGYTTTGYSPSINYPFGRQLVERAGFRTLAVEHINVDTLVVEIAPVPDSIEPRILENRYGGAGDTWNALLASAPSRKIAVRAGPDTAAITGIALPPSGPQATLYAVRVSGAWRGKMVVTNEPIAIVQVTNLGVHTRIGKTEGVVWVTNVNTGAATPGASVVLYGPQGRRLASATTDAGGVARLSGWSDKPDTSSDESESDDDEGGGRSDFQGYVKVASADDRAITGVSDWDPDLSPWRFNAYPAYGDYRLPLAGGVFTERGIYRPGERVFAKAIVRYGLLGALRAPTGRDSLKWIFRDRDEGVLREVVEPLSSFGTADDAIDIPAGAPLGQYNVEVLANMQGAWRQVGEATYRVAEYRPPEFLVDVNAPTKSRFPGDTLVATVSARYLFGAPMGRAKLNWFAQQTPIYSWDLDIPNTDGWYVGESGNWWEDSESNTNVFASGVDTLDVRGEARVAIAMPPAIKGLASRVSVMTSVTDVNRQAVGTWTTVVVHPAQFYIAAKAKGTSWFWTAGTPQTVSVIAVNPDGIRMPGVKVNGTIVRREWHSVRRDRGGVMETVGEWVSDTVAHCSVTTSGDEQSCNFTPPAGGIYTVALSATDNAGRPVSTSFQRWATGRDWVPWSDETQFKMDVIPDRTRYAVGDTATILFASPFTDAEAWITVEREGLIEQRRMRLTSGSTTLKFPITEAYSPNAFVSIIVTRGRSAKPGPQDDPGRPTIRVGYTELRVTPEVKRLSLIVQPNQAEYLPGDSARVNVHVRDTQGNGPRSEVTLWAVDEGVLSLTGYKTPDPIDLIYRQRGLGMRLASNMTSVAPQVPEGEKGKIQPGGGGGAEAADVLRSKFQTTAFFLGSVVSDSAGNAVTTVKLPDNLTTFRVMAVAVTQGDRYGHGESKLLVTRPLLARAALPRFVRGGDQFVAGAVINRRDGAAVPVTVKTQVTGVTLSGAPEKKLTLAASRGSEVRFPFSMARVAGLPDAGDSAAFRFDVTDGRNADAVRLGIPIRADFHPQSTVVAGLLRDTVSVEMLLPTNIDPARSTLSLSLGVSPMAAIREMARSLRVYPYYCSEQVISAATPLIAMSRARDQGSLSALSRDPRADILRAIEMLSRRQRQDGGIGYWSNTDWTTVWLSSYAGLVLADARDAGFPVDTAVLSKLVGYVRKRLGGDTVVAFTPVAQWFVRRNVWLGDQVAGVDFLSRMKQPLVPLEHELFRAAAQMSIEDRARLAEVAMRRNDVPTATALMTSVWNATRVEGRVASLVDSSGRFFYFSSDIRPLARVLMATLAVRPEHELVGPLVEALAERGRVAERRNYWWDTQDYAYAIIGLSAFDRIRKSQGSRMVTVSPRGGRALLSATVSAATRDSIIPLTGLLTKVTGGNAVRLSLRAGGDVESAPVYYYLTVNQIPANQPVNVEEQGIRVERWYERADGPDAGKPVTSVAEGDVVRVRLKVTVPVTRNFVVVDDALPAGLEAIDLSLRTAAPIAGPGARAAAEGEGEEAEGGSAEDQGDYGWGYGMWDAGWWSPFDHRELRDDRVVYSAMMLWPGTYTATYLARATTPGTFIKPPAHAEEMYNPGVHGRSDGGVFVVTPRTR